MRKLLFFLFLLVVVGSAQTRYAWTDTLNINTVGTDTTWDDAWVTATIYCDTTDILLRVGAPDVGSWTSRNWIRLNTGMAYSIGPSPGLKRMHAKTINGTAVLYIIGTKKVRQY